MCLVNKEATLVEVEVETANNRSGAKLKAQFLLFVYFITDIISAFLDEGDFLYFIEFFQDVFIGFHFTNFK